ncbi:MAG: putative bifunctional diguanylate cyclase/phosphodiesterase [Ilumatobacteraceae bacterium]
MALVPMLALQYLTWRDSRDENREARSASEVRDHLETFHLVADLMVPMTIEMTATDAAVRRRDLPDGDDDVTDITTPDGVTLDDVRLQQMKVLDDGLASLEARGVDVTSIVDMLTTIRTEYDDGSLQEPEVDDAWATLNRDIDALALAVGADMRDAATTNDLLTVGNESEQMMAVTRYASEGAWHTMMAAVSGDPRKHTPLVLKSEGALTASLDRFEQVLPADRRADLEELRSSGTFKAVSGGMNEFVARVESPTTDPFVVTQQDDVQFTVAYIGTTVLRLTEIQDFAHDFYDQNAVRVGDIRHDAVRSRWVAITIMILVSVVSLVLLILVMRSILRPLSRLMRQSRKVREGDLHIEPVRPSGPTDLRVVTRAFNEMVSTLQAYESQLDRLARGETKVEQPLPGPLGDTVRRSVSQLANVTAKLHASEAAANLQARTDSLTGLANRTAALERLAIISMQARQNEQPGAVIFLDLDGFKSVNDTQGHAEGDRILVEIADRIRDACPGLVVARIGGDEFLVLVDEAASIDAVASKAAELIELMSAPCTGSNGQLFTLSASAGVAMIDGHSDPLACIAQADTAVYHAKARGRGRVEAFDRKLANVIEERAEMALTMRQGLAERQFSLRLQPIIDVATSAPVGAEVLLRWQRPGIGEVGPAEFIPVAERTGVIVDLEAWVLEQAVGILRDWRLDPVTARMRLAVNISGRHIVEGNLAPLLEELCKRAQVDPTLLDLEITETHLMSDVYRSIVVVDELRAQGVNVSIDDFGTGYSSMSYLHRLTVDALKIDQVFVAGMVDDRLDRTIVELLLRLGDSLGLQVVAEGVDSEAKLALLKELGCPWAQGFHIAKPMSVDDATRWLKQQQALSASMA